MVQTGSIDKGFDERAAYAQSFGNIRHKTCYSDEFGLRGMKSDLRPFIRKAFSTGYKAHSTTSGGAGTAGYAMIPVFVDPQIIDRSRKYTPLTELIPRVTNQGMYADYNVITSKGGAFTNVEDASLSETNTTYDRQSTEIKFLYAVGRVTGPSLAAQPSYVLQGFAPQGGDTGPFVDQAGGNARQQEVLVKARELKELEENLIINGNATTNGVSGNIGPDGSEFDGIITLLGSTNTVDKNTTALDLKDISVAIQYAFDDGGRPNLGVASSAAYTDLEILLHEKFGYVQSMKEVFWGFQTITLRTRVGDIPIISSQFMSNASGSKAIYFLDLSVVEMRVLQDMTYFDLAKTNDTDKFALKIYECLIIKAPTFCSSITEIK